MGIDYGTRRIGLAISDASGSMAFPEKVLLNRGIKASAGDILEIAKDKKVEAIVLGDSVNYRGEQNEIMGEVEMMKAELEKSLPVHYENETMTSAMAERGETKASMLDASAAAIILNSFLARNRKR